MYDRPGRRSRGSARPSRPARTAAPAQRRLGPRAQVPVVHDPGQGVTRLGAVGVDEQPAAAVVDDRVSPPTAAATTGVRRPAPRPRPGRTTRCTTARRRSAAANHCASSLWATGGTNPPLRRGRAPRRAAPATPGARPEPDGPPTTGTTRRLRSSGSRSRSTATARSSTSGALRGWIRPANISTDASSGRSSRRRTSARSRGRNTSRSTPGWITSTREAQASYRLMSCWPRCRCWRSGCRRPRPPAPRR